MTHTRLLVLAALAIVAGLLAAPAQAAPKGECLWNGTSKAARNGYLQQYRTLGAQALEQMKFGDELAESFPACGVATDYEASFEAGAILGTMIMEHGAELVLSEEAGTAVGTMPGLWRDLPEADRDTLRAFARGLIGKDGEDKRVTEAAVVVMSRMTEKVDVAESLNSHIAVYFISRATREVLEAGGMPKAADRAGGQR